MFGVGDARKRRARRIDCPVRALPLVLVTLFVFHASISGVIPALPGFLASLVVDGAPVVSRADE